MSREYILTEIVRLRLEGRFGERFKCYKCNKKFKTGDKVIPGNLRTKKWYCKKCYNKLFIG